MQALVIRLPVVLQTLTLQLPVVLQPSELQAPILLQPPVLQVPVLLLPEQLPAGNPPAAGAAPTRVASIIDIDFLCYSLSFLR
ncbi:hypothetical protein SEVIR_3G149301v4 [Setaria viridis]|uniref:Secreted protein n=1 Tax=Setaria viridis TaxID=4556 RepID=A0A4U6VB93_SETVI|nr:hypothetical protein SEVIR_3G149301v2 [Setaria viridis]